jgi:hypothetical protein
LFVFGASENQKVILQLKKMNSPLVLRLTLLVPDLTLMMMTIMQAPMTRILTMPTKMTSMGLKCSCHTFPVMGKERLQCQTHWSNNMIKEIQSGLSHGRSFPHLWKHDDDHSNNVLI